ncbi:MAG: hypothetical protein Q4E63_05860 [Prevotellaceae bacterium]|nr:hypothetical protein [Prevotellaceae bacterium]
MTKEDILDILKAEYLDTMGLTEEKFGEKLICIGEYLIKKGKRIQKSGQDKRDKSQKLKQHCKQSNDNVSTHDRERKEATVVQKVKPTVLVLFMKADDANALIETIKQKKALYAGIEEDLFVNAMKMWVGTDSQYNNSNVKMEFNRTTNMDSFVKEFDYVAMRFKLDKEYTGYEARADSYDRNQFFTNVCKDSVQLVESSGRLSFNDKITTDAYDVF